MFLGFSLSTKPDSLSKVFSSKEENTQRMPRRELCTKSVTFLTAVASANNEMFKARVLIRFIQFVYIGAPKQLIGTYGANSLQHIDTQLHTLSGLLANRVIKQPCVIIAQPLTAQWLTWK